MSTKKRIQVIPDLYTKETGINPPSPGKMGRKGFSFGWISNPNYEKEKAEYDYNKLQYNQAHYIVDNFRRSTSGQGSYKTFPVDKFLKSYKPVNEDIFFSGKFSMVLPQHAHNKPTQNSYPIPMTFDFSKAGVEQVVKNTTSPTKPTVTTSKKGDMAATTKAIKKTEEADTAPSVHGQMTPEEKEIFDTLTNDDDAMKSVRANTRMDTADKHGKIDSLTDEDIKNKIRDDIKTGKIEIEKDDDKIRVGNRDIKITREGDGGMSVKDVTPKTTKSGGLSGFVSDALGFVGEGATTVIKHTVGEEGLGGIVTEAVGAVGDGVIRPVMDYFGENPEIAFAIMVGGPVGAAYAAEAAAAMGMTAAEITAASATWGATSAGATYIATKGGGAALDKVSENINLGGMSDDERDEFQLAQAEKDKIYTTTETEIASNAQDILDEANKPPTTPTTPTTPTEAGSLNNNTDIATIAQGSNITPLRDTSAEGISNNVDYSGIKTALGDKAGGAFESGATWGTDFLGRLPRMSEDPQVRSALNALQERVDKGVYSTQDMMRMRSAARQSAKSETDRQLSQARGQMSRGGIRGASAQMMQQDLGQKLAESQLASERSLMMAEADKRGEAIKDLGTFSMDTRKEDTDLALKEKMFALGGGKTFLDFLMADQDNVANFPIDLQNYISEASKEYYDLE